MKKNLYFIDQGLPNSFSGGTALLSINLIKELRKNYNIIAINTLKNFYNTKGISKVEKELKNHKIKFINVKKESKNIHLKNITIFNFFKPCYFYSEKISEIKLFLN